MNRCQVSARGQSGFTLIELMIVVLVVSILAAVAYPNYSRQVIDSRRAEGKSLIAEAANRLERCFTRFNAYDNAACNDAGNMVSEGGWYQVSAVRTATAFTLTATPLKTQADKDECGSLTLTSTGVRGHSGTPPAGTNCW